MKLCSLTNASLSCRCFFQGICIAKGNEDVVRRTNDESGGQELQIEFGDLNHYAKSTPILELKSRDNIDALCRVQIKWKQVRPDIWVAQRGAFTDPFDMLEEKCANMMRDWLLSSTHQEALVEKAKGFATVEHQWTSELGEAGLSYGVEVLGIEITTLRFPHIDKQDEKMALQMADTNLQIEISRQSATKEHETSILNQATHIRQQEDRDRTAQAEETQQLVQQRINRAAAETTTKKAEMDTKVVQAEMKLELARQNKEKEVTLAKATAEAEAERVRAQGAKDAAQLAAEGEIAATKQKNEAMLSYLEKQAALLKSNPGLIDLLQLQNDFLKTECLANAAKFNPNVVLLSGQEGLEARRMLNGHAPQVPNGAILSSYNP
jgi:regulator of protease activity HflC (stomatin/prohibitin superfamily)